MKKRTKIILVTTFLFIILLFFMTRFILLDKGTGGIMHERNEKIESNVK